jgi:hypothetical protein
MTTAAQSFSTISKPWQWVAIGAGVCLVWAAIAIPVLHRSAELGPQTAHLRQVEESYLPVLPMKAKSTVLMAGADAARAEVAVRQQNYSAGASMARKIIRTSSLEMIVQHPAESAEKIFALVEGLGGYLETSSAGGENATSATLTVRVPADRFEQALAEIRKLGLQVQSERVDAQDVTRQYVDQDANIRNLRLEETQYLAILKQASTVKDMMVVSTQLSEVRGQIERQQAEFNALSRQIETVSISIALRTEADAQTFGLNWRPLYQLKVALHDGLESVATYTVAMITVLFYLPAALLWAGTILVGLIGSWRMVRWIGLRWFGWNPTDSRVNN